MFDYANYPNDDTHIMPIADIEEIVFISKSFADVKKALLNYAHTNAKAKEQYNLTEETINNLFEFYED